MESVRSWAAERGFDYHFTGDEIFDPVADEIRERWAGRLPVISDLARLVLLKRLLATGYDRAVWMDADVLIFDPARFDVDIQDDYAFGRETWVQYDRADRWRVFVNVHNAVCLFHAQNSFLDFYLHACERILATADANATPAQIVGPKLLSALHNLIGIPLLEDAGALSPAVLLDISQGTKDKYEDGGALDTYRRRVAGPIRVANLCASLVGEAVPGAKPDGSVLTESVMDAACDRLLETRGAMLSPQ